ncbi:MAG TPA: ATP-binding protein [Bacteroidales bacterium]|nr:ATP-binding protein [Bacteroidales bacterium]
MRFFYKEKKVRNGYIGAFGLLMVSYFLVFLTMHQMDKRARMVNHTNEIINNLDILLSCIKDSEGTFRGIAIMEDTTLLDAYNFHLNCIGSSFDQVASLIQNDRIQLAKLDSIKFLVSEKTKLLNFTIEDIRSGIIPEHNVLYNRVIRGTNIMEIIRNMIFRMQTYESERLAKRTVEFESMTKTLKVIQLITFMVALLLIIYSVLVFNNVSRSKMQYRVQLEEGIEQLKEANEDLKNLRSMEKFTASGRIARAIAHEVRNPLTSISLAADQLQSSSRSSDETTLINIIMRSVKRINDLIVSLLQSTKFSHLNLEPLSLNTVVDEALELAKDRIELNGITVEKNLSPNQCTIEADKDKLITAVLNLIINAVEAMEPGKGIIEITTMRRNEKCMVYIKDNGMGMNESALSRIFEPYFTQKENGNGLGLTLTQNIILNHKGTISVESKPKKGTTFTIALNNAE